jgi:uncharacterized protein YkwD
MPPSILALLAAAVLAFSPVRSANRSDGPMPPTPPAIVQTGQPTLVATLDGARRDAATDPLFLRQLFSLARRGLEADAASAAFGAADLVRDLGDRFPEIGGPSSAAGVPDDAANVAALLALAEPSLVATVFDEQRRRAHIHFATPGDLGRLEQVLRAHADRYLTEPLASSLVVRAAEGVARVGSHTPALVGASLFVLLAFAPSLARKAAARSAAMFPSAAALVWIAADRADSGAVSEQAIHVSIALAALGLLATAALVLGRRSSPAAMALAMFLSSGAAGCVAGGAGQAVVLSAEARADAEFPPAAPGARDDPRQPPDLVIVEVPSADLHERAAGPEDGLHRPTDLELALAVEVNAYRARHGQRSIPWSRSLSQVAHAHARDLSAHPPSRKCMIHSWSEAGSWTPCCYAPDHSNARCMWNKPIELTSYRGIGFEIAYMHSAGIRPEMAVKAWRASQVHREVLLNRARWADNVWRAMGVGVSGNYAVVWFGQEWDPAGYWKGADH